MPISSAISTSQSQAVEREDGSPAGGAVGPVMWADLAAAVALVLVLEGILPFVSPRSWRDAMLMVARLDDRALRVLGLSSMLLGLILLKLVR